MIKLNNIILYRNEEENINNLVSMNEITKDKDLVLSQKEIMMLIENKNNVYKSFLSIKNEFSFNDEVNSYLDKYYFKIIRTIIYFIDNRNIECLIGKNNVVIV